MSTTTASDPETFYVYKKIRGNLYHVLTPDRSRILLRTDSEEVANDACAGLTLNARNTLSQVRSLLRECVTDDGAGLTNPARRYAAINKAAQEALNLLGG